MMNHVTLRTGVMAAEDSAVSLLKKKIIIKLQKKTFLNCCIINAALVSIPINNRKTIMITIMVVCE